MKKINFSKEPLPKSVIILGVKYTIKEKDNLDHNNTPVDGLFNPNTYTILVNSGLEQWNKWHALFHEIGHGLMEENSINQSLSEEMEHIIVESYAKLFVRLFL